MPAGQTAPGQVSTEAGGGPSNSTAVEGEIIVTAQKRTERLQDVPMSITAVGGDDLVKTGVNDIAQLTKISPGFTYQSSNSGLPIYGIRGISFFDNSPITNPAVSVYVDQVSLPFSALTRGAVLDVERVEILKGPQGTLFGQNATGGAINYISAKPTSTYRAGGNLSYGRFGEFIVDGFVSSPLSSDLGLRVSARSDQRGNWQRSTQRDEENGERDFLAGRVILEWEPAAGANLTLNVNGWRDKSDTQTPQFVRFAPFVPNGAYQPPFVALRNYGPVPDTARETDFDPGIDFARDDDFWQTALSGSVDLTPDITLTSLTSYLEYRQDSLYDGDATNYLDVRSNIIARVKDYSQELRLSGEISALRWMIGGSVDRQKLFENVRTRSGGTNSLLAGVILRGLSTTNSQQVDTEAVFGSLDLEVGGGVTLQASGRYTWQDRDFAGCTADLGDGSANAFSAVLTRILTGAPPINPNFRCTTLDAVTRQQVASVNRTLDQNNFSWRLGANWKAAANTLLYANVTKGYKAGSFTTIPLTFSDQASQVGQESVQAYEAGFKTDLLNRRLTLNGAAFHYDFKDKQTLSTVSLLFLGNFPALVNIPSSRVNGIELSADVRPIDGLRFNLAGTYVDAKANKSFVVSTALGTAVDVNGEQLPNTPKWQLAGDGEYGWTVKEGLEAYVGGTITYRTRSFANFGELPDLVLPGYALVDLRVGVTGGDGRWRAQLWGRNVTDRYYFTNAGRTIDTVYRFAGMPATYGVTLGFSY